MSRTAETRTVIDEAARVLAMADIQLGDPGHDQREIERLLLSALNLTLHALQLLRGAP